MTATCPRCGRVIRLDRGVLIVHGQPDGLPCSGSNVNPRKLGGAR